MSKVKTKEGTNQDGSVLVDLEDIQVGDHYRKELKNIESLAASIQNVGLINPLTIQPDRTLISGWRRYHAIKSIANGESEVMVPCRIARDHDDAVKILMLERDENEEREPLTPSEAVALGEALEALEAPKAAERKRTARVQAEDLGEGGEDPHDPEPKTKEKGRTREKVAKAVGMSGETYRKAKAVVKAAARVAANQYLVADMDKTGKVDRAHRKLQAREAKADPKKAKAQADKPKVVKVTCLNMEAGETRKITCPCCREQFTIQVK